MDVANSLIFLDVPKEQQVIELASYIAAKKEENPEDGPFVSNIKHLLDSNQFDAIVQQFIAEAPMILQKATDRELEPEFNMIISVLRYVSSEQLSKFVETLLDPFTKIELTRPIPLIKILGNLFNNLDSTSAARFSVYLTIVKVAARSNRLNLILPHLQNLDSLVKQATVEQTRELCLLLHDSLFAAEYFIESHKCLLKYLTSFESGSPVAEAKQHATKALVEAINIPTEFQFDDLLKLKAVQQLQQEKVFELVKVFVSSDLNGFEACYKANKDHFTSLGFNYDHSKNKMRLITIGSICAQHVGGEVPYTDLAAAIAIDASEIERWIIDAVRFRLVDAKIDQLNRVVVVSGATYRDFNKKQWQDLSERLATWKLSVNNVLQVVQNAKLIAQSQGVA